MPKQNELSGEATRMEVTRIPIDRLLAKLGQGRHTARVYAAIESVAREVQRTGNPGTITVKFKITSPPSSPYVALIATITQTMPTTEPDGAIVFVDRQIEGLYAQDPRQLQMGPVRLVETGEHVVDADTSEIIQEA